jgi:catechol 2,3-dioxygenase-like lactoylglutathione lyase family enzyme
MRIDRIRVPVATLVAAAQSYRALGFHLIGDEQSLVASTPTGGLELASGGTRPEIVISAPSPAPEVAAQLPLVVEVTSPPVSGEVAHPNTVLKLERVYVVTTDIERAVRLYSTALGLAVPPVQRGTVIRADMAVFDVGPVGIGVAEPFEDGPAAQALQRQGPGVFQALFRVSSMARAASVITGNGLPAPARGIRNNGEQALLVGPDLAWGLFVALVGPE